MGYSVNEKPVYCRIKESESRILRNLRERNRLYLRLNDGKMVPVPNSMGSSEMQKRITRGSLFCLTNGIH